MKKNIDTEKMLAEIEAMKQEVERLKKEKGIDEILEQASIRKK